MLLEGRAGQAALSDGAIKELRLARSGAQVTTDAHGRYTEATLRGNVFFACNQASTTFTLFGNTTATGFILCNPTGSGKNLVVLDIAYAQVVAATTAISNFFLSVGINQNVTTHTTPLTIQAALIGSGASSVAKADSAATLPAAGVLGRPLWSTSISATATTSVPPVQAADLGGLVIVAPGSFVQVAAGFTNTMTGVVSMYWEEIPI